MRQAPTKRHISSKISPAIHRPMRRNSSHCSTIASSKSSPMGSLRRLTKSPSKSSTNRGSKRLEPCRLIIRLPTKNSKLYRLLRRKKTAQNIDYIRRPNIIQPTNRSECTTINAKSSSKSPIWRSAIASNIGLNERKCKRARAVPITLAIYINCKRRSRASGQNTRLLRQSRFQFGFI